MIWCWLQKDYQNFKDRFWAAMFLSAEGSNTSNCACCFGDALRSVAFRCSKHGASQSAIGPCKTCNPWLDIDPHLLALSFLTRIWANIQSFSERRSIESWAKALTVYLYFLLCTRFWSIVCWSAWKLDFALLKNFYYSYQISLTASMQWEIEIRFTVVSRSK